MPADIHVLVHEVGRDGSVTFYGRDKQGNARQATMHCIPTVWAWDSAYGKMPDVTLSLIHI